MPLLEGATFAGFTIVRLLGSGGMGEVYLAQHPRLPRRDALKLLPPEWSADDDYRARFIREADLASTLWHPHIVGVHDRGEAGRQLWISMDYVDGLDAARLLTDRYPTGMPVEDVVRIVTAMASGLDYAHKQGLPHRDVKPANIMLTHLDDNGEQRILLADFGIARDITDISGLTTTNMTVGTVAYSAPEQLMGEDIDGRADQYALAATAYHLLTGSHLFPHSNPAVVISRHLNAPPPAIADTRPDIAGVDSALAVALAKDPEKRFARCADFARALGEHATTVSAQSPLAVTMSAHVPHGPRPTPARSSAERPYFQTPVADPGRHFVRNPARMRRRSDLAAVEEGAAKRLDPICSVSQRVADAVCGATSGSATAYNNHHHNGSGADAGARPGEQRQRSLLRLRYAERKVLSIPVGQHQLRDRLPARLRNI